MSQLECEVQMIDGKPQSVVAGGVHAILDAVNNSTINRRKPRNLFSKVYGDSKSMKVISMGDSLTHMKMAHLSPMMDRYFGGSYLQGEKDSNNISPETTAGRDCYFSGEGVTSGSQFEYWFTGDVRSLSDTQASTCISGGVDPSCQYIEIFYVREPSSGSLQLKVDGIVVDTVDTSHTEIDGGILTYDKGEVNSDSIELVAVGNIKLIAAHVSSDLDGLDFYSIYYGKGGLNLKNPMANDNCKRVMTTILSHVNADFLTFEMDDEFGQDTDTAQAFEDLADIWNASIPNADKIIIASTPRAANDEGKLLSLGYLATFVSSADASYLLFDGYTPMGSYEQMVSIFGSDDGVHPNSNTETFLASIMWDWLGLNLGYAGRNPNALNAIGDPSRFKSGSSFVGPGGRSLVVETDPSFGYDWDVTIPRSIRFKDPDTDNVLMQLGHSGFASLMPKNSSFVDAENYITTVSSFGIRLSDSSKDGYSNGVGNALFKAMHVPPTISKANLTGGDYNPATREGVRVNVPDGAGGAGVYVVRSGAWVNEETGLPI